MFNEISNLERRFGRNIITPVGNNLHTLLGKMPENADPEMMLYFYKIVGTYVHQMYYTLLRNREGVGLSCISKSKVPTMGLTN